MIKIKHLSWRALVDLTQNDPPAAIHCCLIIIQWRWDICIFLSFSQTQFRDHLIHCDRRSSLLIIGVWCFEREWDGNAALNVSSAAHRGHLQPDVSLSALHVHSDSARVHGGGASAGLSDAGAGEPADRDGSAGQTQTHSQLDAAFIILSWEIKSSSKEINADILF